MSIPIVRAARLVAATVIAGLVAGCSLDRPSYDISDLPAPQQAALLRGHSEGLTAGFSDETIRNIEARAPWIAPFARTFKFRKAWLEDKPDAHAYVVDRAEPLDIIISGNRSRIAGLAGGGLFGHAAVYLGTEAELREMGVWDHPAFVPHHEDIRAGKVGIEAVGADVHLADPPHLFEADHLAVYRPTNITPARRKGALIALMGYLGRSFDYNFNSADPSAMYCTELIDVAIPELGLPSREMFGREIMMPDDIAAGTYLGELPFEFQFYIPALPNGWEVKDEIGLVADLVGQRL